MSTQTQSGLPRKLVVVVGATGGQGGSVVNRLLSDDTYRIRGISRNVQSSGAQDLIKKGVEMVSADFNDPESLTVAFKDANIIFAYTNFFETFPTHGPAVAMASEYAQGVNMARAASAVPTLEHFIWSTLPDRKEISNGKWSVPHCESKARVDKFIKNDTALLAKTTFLWTALYASTINYPLFTPNLLETAGKYIWLQPVPPSTPCFTIGDHTINIGHFAHAIMNQPKLTLNGRYVFATTETLTLGQVLSIWSEITGSPIEYLQISLEEYNRLWPMWGLEVALDLKCWEEFGAQSWGGEKWIGKEELGLGKELVGIREALAQLLKSPQK